MRALDGDPVVYASEQAHNSVDKAVALLGIGWDGLSHLRTDADYRLDVAALARAVAEDRAAGRLHLAVLGQRRGP